MALLHLRLPPKFFFSAWVLTCYWYAGKELHNSWKANQSKKRIFSAVKLILFFKTAAFHNYLHLILTYIA